MRERWALVGYALDGYGVYVEKRAWPAADQRRARRLSWHSSRVQWTGKQQRIYHYVATLEYPYTVGCFHGTAISSGGRLANLPVARRQALRREQPCSQRGLPATTVRMGPTCRRGFRASTSA